ncbi:unnamed protein product, partial [Ascophyllum nodosum]
MSSSNPRFNTTSNNRGWGYERREGFHGSGGQGGGEQVQGRGRGRSRGWGGRLNSNTGRDPDGTRDRSSTKSWERGVRREHHFLSRGGRGGGSGSVGGRELSGEGRDHSPTLPHSSKRRAHPIAESAPAPVSPACTGTSSPSIPNAAAVTVENVVSGDTSTALGSVTPPAPQESGWGTPDAHRSRSPSPSQSHGSHGFKRSGWADGGDGLEDRESIRARDKRERNSAVLERKRMADRLGSTTFADVDRERGCEGRDNDAEGWGSSSVVDIIPNKDHRAERAEQEKDDTQQQDRQHDRNQRHERQPQENQEKQPREAGSQLHRQLLEEEEEKQAESRREARRKESNARGRRTTGALYRRSTSTTGRLEHDELECVYVNADVSEREPDPVQARWNAISELNERDHDHDRSARAPRRKDNVASLYGNSRGEGDARRNHQAPSARATPSGSAAKGSKGVAHQPAAVQGKGNECGAECGGTESAAALMSKSREEQELEREAKAKEDREKLREIRKDQAAKDAARAKAAAAPAPAAQAAAPAPRRTAETRPRDKEIVASRVGGSNRKDLSQTLATPMIQFGDFPPIAESSRRYKGGTEDTSAATSTS